MSPKQIRCPPNVVGVAFAAGLLVTRGIRSAVFGGGVKRGALR